MDNEEQANLTASEQSPKPSLLPDRMTSHEVVEGLRKPEAELAATETELKRLEADEDAYQWPDEYHTHVFRSYSAVR